MDGYGWPLRGWWCCLADAGFGRGSRLLVIARMMPRQTLMRAPCDAGAGWPGESGAALDIAGKAWCESVRRGGFGDLLPAFSCLSPFSDPHRHLFTRFLPLFSNAKSG